MNDQVDLLTMIMRMVGCLATIITAAFFTTKYWLKRQAAPHPPDGKTYLFLGAIFGILSIYGTLGGFVYQGLFLNLRDAGPLIGGLYFGPWVGLPAALLGAGHRFLVGYETCLHPGDSTIPCLIATLCAGLVGSFVYYRNQRRRPRLGQAVGLGLLMAVFHMGVVTAYEYEMGKSFYAEVWQVWVGCYVLAMSSYAFAVEHLLKQRASELEGQLLAGELLAARDIQKGILSTAFTALPYPERIKLYAILTPAREVSGDFYDFFMLDERRLMVLVGDVSGKGVPAAFFMAVSRTYLRAKNWRVRSANEIFAEVNTELENDNPSSMFVTVFAAIIDLPTGKTALLNAGHNPPLLVQANGAVAWLKEPRGVALGMMPQQNYSSVEIQLQAGDVLLLYSDGVTEAEHENQAQFGAARLLHCVEELPPESSPQDYCHAIVKAVNIFVEHTAPSDDLTVLGVKYTAP